MRFHSDGPDLPDELLADRDEGRVLFFCGAGISQQNAGLPGFFSLAKRVLDELRALPDSASRQFLDIANDLRNRVGSQVGTTLAADRLFSLLEREFDEADIDRAVGQVLRPGAHVDLTAHRIMLALGRTQNGAHQLVTTNFDLLFEMARPGLTKWTPENLPDLSRGRTFEGVVHLHGMFDQGYMHPEGGRLVLSSATFGRAYLAEGWATRFILDAVAQYSIVFVGYAADDPPVQYLLEALARIPALRRHGLFAFQPGSDSAAVLWKHRGVTALPYIAGRHGHSGLWDTLAAWARRARNPDQWRASVLRKAQKGPALLAPHERGQVMHLAMTRDGVKKIVTATRPLSAEWLLCFDPSERFAVPMQLDPLAPRFDPFSCYGLDRDPVPESPTENAATLRREIIPRDSLDALASNYMDVTGPELVCLHGDGGSKSAPLPERLAALAAWIGKICGQPSAVWWASNKPALHHAILSQAAVRLEQRADPISPVAYIAWRYMLETKDARRGAGRPDFYGLQRRVAQQGWSEATRRSLVELLVPQLRISRPIGKRPIRDIRHAKLWDLISLGVDYKDEILTLAIPDDQLEHLVPAVRAHLEIAARLEAETSPFALNHIPPIAADPGFVGEAYERDHGFNARILWYADLYRRLAARNQELAIAEFDAWRVQRNTLFYRLRVWAVGQLSLLDEARAADTFLDLPDEAFWTERGQRDLLLALKARWSSFDGPRRKRIQDRLRRGPRSFPRLTPEQNRSWKAQMILGRLGWLQNQGCAFDFDVDAVVARVRRNLPHWSPAQADHAADSREGRAGFVASDPSYDQLKDAPIGELLSRALAERGHQADFLVHHDPLAGLSQDRPVRILRALLFDTLAPEDSQAAWASFLQSQARQKDKIRLVRLIAARLLGLGSTKLSTILRPAAYWLRATAQALYEADPDMVGNLVERLAGALAALPPDPKAKTEFENSQRDWLTAALNAPAGELTQILLNDPVLKTISPGTPPPGLWLRHVEALLALSDDHGRFAFVLTCVALGWFYCRDTAWTETYLLDALNQPGIGKELLLTAFLYQPNVPTRKMYDRLKPTIMALISGAIMRPSPDARALVHFLLGGWLTLDQSERWLSDIEMRTALVRGSPQLRTGILWQVDQWDIQEKLYFLKEVWPLQLGARSEIVTDRMCALAFRDQPNFALLADAIMPFLTTLNRGGHFFFGVVNNAPALLDKHPHLVLDIFDRVLGANSAEWPYGAHDAVARLGKVRDLRSDPQMRELMRRLHKGYR